MDRKEIEGKFWAAINQAVAAAGAEMGDQAKGFLKEAVEIGAQEISRLSGERLQGAVAQGVEAYEELIAEAAETAKRYDFFPVLDLFVLTEAMRSVGNRAPFWF
jgi:16S rRNA U1498 N3-methylase RsmE